MNRIDNGGPAFPVGHDGFYKQGMTLRDYFAGQALSGVLSADNSNRQMYGNKFAIDAYAVADAMIKARSKV